MYRLSHTIITNELTLFRFLFAKLYLDLLIRKKSLKAIKTKLKKLLIGLRAYDYTYNNAIERIDCQITDS